MRAAARAAFRPSRDEAVAALASAALFAIAFPPFPLLVPVLVCLVPLAVNVARRADAGDSARSGFRTGFWLGLLGYGCNLYWIAIALSLYTKLAILGYVGALIWLAPQVALAGAALHVARRATRAPMALLLPIVWVASELALNYLSDLSFPWLPLGLAVTPVPALAQLAEVSGVRGVSFWIAAVNGLLADGWLSWRGAGSGDRSAGPTSAAPRSLLPAPAARAAAALAIIAAAYGYGAWRMRHVVMRDVAAVAVVQPNIPQEEKWQAENRDRIVGILSQLTRERLAGRDAALVLWPEVALPGFLFEHGDWRDTLRVLARVDTTPILFGVLDATSQEDYFNAAMLADSLGTVDDRRAYHKEFLVPVVERVPFLNPKWFASFQYFGGYGRGSDPQPYQLPFGRVGVLICYESIFPQLSLEYRRKGVDLLANITNDAWFGRSLAPHQHAAHLVLRAIEHRVGVVRSANTGISEYVDPLGRVHGATPLFTRETRTYRAQTTDVLTLYDRFGDWIGTLCLVSTALLVAYGSWRRRVERRAAGAALLAESEEA